MISRYKRPAGWRGESHRHYLAARGVRTNRYYAIDAKRMAAGIKSFFSDGRPDTEDYGKRMDAETIEQQRSEVVRKLQQAEDTGKITHDNAKRFMDDQFTSETKDFLNGTIDRRTYLENVKRKLDSHMGTNSKSLSLFGGSQ
jgi:hypothetical protein